MYFNQRVSAFWFPFLISHLLGRFENFQSEKTKYKGNKRFKETLTYEAISVYTFANFFDSLKYPLRY